MGRDQSFETGRGHLLLINQDNAELATLAEGLGRHHRLQCIADIERLSAQLNSEPPDLIVLDAGWWQRHAAAFEDDLGQLQAARLPVLMFGAASSEQLNTWIAQGAREHLQCGIPLTLALRRIASQLDLDFCREQLRSRSTQDPLTGLANRAHLDEFLTATFLQAKRRNESIALIMFEIDRLKPYNEAYGYAAGDDVLVLVGRTLSALRRRPLDLFARYGGDQFACVLPNTDIEGARTVADMLKADVAALAIEHRHSDLARHITISLGVVAIEPAPPSQPRELLDAALQALEDAKTNRPLC
ncbi:diguanylate cyclase [Pseudomarimonas arenosa]|uniref:diguanylate cyclase n=1 Tax=Pseudomarimonas arenosa TaxID=2774145 RepID=A0AAW3ZKX4_9GAMM|nr:diguanylate cyclase [Pseudomarimonas arenosa]MBD8526755.1 GGDEF domain-containing protein [Pseudomarimonas arenosa]